MAGIELIILIIIFLFSVVIHEVAHGWVAYAQGDPTAKYAGRLTLNPIKHLSFFGFIVLPLVTYLMWGFPIGSAKPVPYNPYNLRNQKYGSAIVAAAGPGVNLLLVLIFGLALRYMPLQIAQNLPYLSVAFSMVLFYNLLLAAFNLMPIPPLDGSKIFIVFLPHLMRAKLASVGQQIRTILFSNWIITIILFFLLAPYILRPLFILIIAIVQPIYSFFGGVLFF